jgi:hypothetical protein
MDHSRAQNLFKEIQSRPYSLSLSADEASNNCFFKGSELLQQLGIMGYTVRGRVAETYWDPKIFGKEITSLLPENMLVTHFYTEIFLDDKWRILDPSFQPSLASKGLTIGSWENGLSCFPIAKLYTQEESLAYQAQWFEQEYQDKFFLDGNDCWKALKKWFSDHAREHSEI